MAAWTLPVGMGVKTVTVNEPLKALMEPVAMEQFLKSPFPEELEEYIILDSRYNNSFRAAFELLGKGKTVYRNSEHPDFSPGSFLVRKSEAQEILKSIHSEAPLQLTSRKEISLQQFRRLRPFKVGLYQNWGHNMIEGWLRYVFDEYKIPYETVHPQDVAKKDFAAKFDVRGLCRRLGKRNRIGQTAQKMGRMGKSRLLPNFPAASRKKAKNCSRKWSKTAKF